VIQGKGKGLVFVLHGTPGTGKTLTAEGIADLLKRPLYSVSMGELGSSAKVLEAALSQILEIAHHWGAVLLIDEADTFLEQRGIHDLHRNAMVSVFLKQLEYFSGVLFLTTNRVNTFDDAFQSRIHVALRYAELDVPARRKIWGMFIDRIKSVQGMETTVVSKDLDKLANKHVLNGRQIKNVVRTAQALAENEKTVMAMNHLLKVLEVGASFERDLKGGPGYQDAMRAYN